MIRTSQSREEVQKVIDKFAPGSMGRKIITIIDTSPMTFSYNDLFDLEFEVNLRVGIINASYGLHRSGLDFAVFRKTRCNERYWHRNRDGGLQLNRGVNSSDAIEDIYINGRFYATECATAMVIVYYKALLDVYPRELFNQTFNDITLMNWHYLDRNLREIGLMNNMSGDIPGDRRYFKNPDVDLATPEWQGENVIDLGTGKYYGHGMGIHAAPVIIRELNRNRRQGSTTSAYLMEVAGNPNYKKLSNILSNYESAHSVRQSA